MPMMGIRKVISTTRLKIKNRLPIMVAGGLSDSESLETRSEECDMRREIGKRAGLMHLAMYLGTKSSYTARDAEGLRSQRVQMRYAPRVKERDTEGRGSRGIEKR